MAEYTVLSEDEKDDVIVTFMLSQEKDKYCHELNKARYEAMLKTLEDGDWKNRVTRLYEETLKRLEEVNSIIEATKPQLPSPEKISFAKKRLLARESRTWPT